MLRITGEGTAHTCDGVTRRDFLQVGALGAVGLTLPQLLAAEEKAADYASLIRPALAASLERRESSLSG